MLRLLVAAMGALAAPAALAADLITVPIDSTGSSIPVSEGGAADWSGFYAGLYGVVGNTNDTGMQLGLGLSAGVNAQIDFVLVGAEVNLQGLTGDNVDTAYGQIVGRAGLVLSDDVLLYAAAGYGWDLAEGEGNALAGGGVEFAVNDELSLNAQYLRGFDVAGEAPTDQVTLGARFQF